MLRSINVLVMSLKDRGAKSVESGGSRKECVVKECVDVGRRRDRRPRVSQTTMSMSSRSASE